MNISSKNTYVLLTMVTALIVFVLVTFVFTMKNGFVYDEVIIDWLNNFSSTTLTKVMEFISLLGSSEVILLVTFVVAAIFAIKRNWLFTIFFLVVSVGGVALNFILKFVFQRERPGGEISYIEVFNFSFEIPSYSFPSGHTMRITILLLFLIYISYRFIKHTGIKVLSYVVCTLTMIGVALSRLFLDAHFLSDTLAAISISVVWFCICLLLFNRYEKKNAFYRRG